MAKDFLLEIEKFGTTENLKFIQNLIKNKISLEKKLNSYNMWNNEIAINLYIEDEYAYGTDDPLTNEEQGSLIIYFTLLKESTYKAILMREIIIHEIEKEVSNSFVVVNNDEDKYFEKVKGNHNYKVFLNKDRYIYFDKSEIALFFYWAFQKNFLHPNVEKIIHLYKKEISVLDNVSILKLMYQTINNDLIFTYVKEEYMEFVVFYTAKINYDSPENINLYTNIGNTYNELIDFKNIDKEYNKLYDMFEEAYKLFLGL